jgi:hypothetical protein
VLIAGLVLACACESETEFVCGTRIEGTETIRRCDGFDERCICATGGCAVPDPLCASGLRYVGFPFADPAANRCESETRGRRERCVCSADAETELDQSEEALSCRAPTDADAGGPDAATIDASVGADADSEPVDAAISGGDR